ncbi:MAG TPA: DNA polymerase III subunit gamma/tau [Patescibacteria group bacterium]|nr:DNA polymerase III subunit gamma/tau [Patescibacteria group bacterium]
MAVLYRKYRPQTFGEVVNQKYIIQTLKNQVLSGQVAHAYLFTGSRGVGKTSVARILAKAVNCLQPALGDACGKCSICKQVEAGNFIDLVEVDAASNTGVDNIRELIEHVRFSPSLGKYKVFIIDEVHMLSKGAFNALLKTLEEPPRHAIFILATTEVHKVPPTIISRTQKFDFKSLAAADLLAHLREVSQREGLRVSDEVLQLVAQNAEGSARDALSLLGKVLTLGDDPGLEVSRALLGVTDAALCERLLRLLAEGRAAAVPPFLQDCSERGLDYAVLTRDFLEFLRQVLIYKLAPAAAAPAALPELAEAFSSAELIFIIRLFLKAYKDLAAAPEPQIPFLIAAVEAALRKAKGGPEAKAAGRAARPAIAAAPETPAAAAADLGEQLPPSVPQSATASLQEVEQFWPEVIAKVKEKNGPLASLLKNSPLLAVENGRAVLKSRFLFDKNTLESPKNAALICQIFGELSGRQIGLAGRVVKEEHAAAEGAAPTLADALKIFGGELVE